MRRTTARVSASGRPDLMPDPWLGAAVPGRVDDRGEPGGERAGSRRRSGACSLPAALPRDGGRSALRGRPRQRQDVAASPGVAAAVGVGFAGAGARRAAGGSRPPSRSPRRPAGELDRRQHLHVLGERPRAEVRRRVDGAVVAEVQQAGRVHFEMEVRRRRERVAGIPDEAEHVAAVNSAVVRASVV